MNDILFDILKIVVSICTALISFYLIPFLKSKLSDVKYSNLNEIINIAVLSAEQTIKGEGRGGEKKQEVLRFVRNWLNEHGVQISEEQLNALIECAVYQMNQDKTMLIEDITKDASN